jgi:hypothetical protein
MRLEPPFVMPGLLILVVVIGGCRGCLQHGDVAGCFGEDGRSQCTLVYTYIYISYLNNLTIYIRTWGPSCISGHCRRRPCMVAVGLEVVRPVHRR